MTQIYEMFNISNDIKHMKVFLKNYRGLYEHTSLINGVSKYALLSNTMSVLLIVLAFEKGVKKQIRFRRIAWEVGYPAECFKKICKRNKIPSISLEHIFILCDFVEISFADLKNLALSKIAQRNSYKVERELVLMNTN